MYSFIQFLVYFLQNSHKRKQLLKSKRLWCLSLKQVKTLIGKKNKLER